MANHAEEICDGGVDSFLTPHRGTAVKVKAARGNAANCAIAIGTIAAVSLLAFQASAQQTSPQQPQSLQKPTPEQIEQALQKLTPAQADMVRPLLQQALPTQGGQIRGFVAASFPGNPKLRDVALPGAKVFVKKEDGEPDQDSVTSTNGIGRFSINQRPPGTYNVCASLTGFTTKCASITVGNQNVFLSQNLSLKPIGASLRGCVTLKDGTPAVRTAASVYQTAASAEVSAVNDAGKIVAGPVPVNSAGCYVLPGVPEIQFSSVAVRYEDARQAVPADTLASLNGPIVNVLLPNAPPAITAFTSALDGKDVSHAPMGATVTVKVDATSPENYPLHYKWADGAGAVLPGDQASLQWPLPNTNSLNLLFVEVSDGHGGVARASLPVSTGPASTAEQNQRQTAPAGVPRRFNPITPLIRFPHPGAYQFIDPALFMNVSDCGGDLSICAQSYYQSLGVLDAAGNPRGPYQNFRTWKSSWGFSDNPTKPVANETRAVFYNNADLQFGRDMHCLTSLRADPLETYVRSITNVCYVANFSDFTEQPGGDPQTSVVNAETNTNPIAVVAMINLTWQRPLRREDRVPRPITWENVPLVSFVVFAPPPPCLIINGCKPSNLGQPDDFVPSLFAVLDSDGPKAVPGVCIACHGGTYDHASNSTPHARFLPFDTSSYRYDHVNTAFSPSSQSEAFRQLNVIVRDSSTQGQSGRVDTRNDTIPTSQSIRDLINGWYPCGVDTPNCTFNDAFIPTGTCNDTVPPALPTPATCGWTTAFANSNPTGAQLYQQIPRVYCRTCHLANADAFNWQNFVAFEQKVQETVTDPNSPNQKISRLCEFIDNYYMPLAQVPYDDFWGSTAAQTALTTLLQDAGAGSSSVPCPPLTPP